MSERKCVNCQHHKFATSSGDCVFRKNNMSYSTVFEHSCDQWEDKQKVNDYKDCKKCIHSDICIFIEENPDCIQFQDRADVVEVVRCQDCKKAKKTLSGYYICPYTLGLYHYADDYCSYGERKQK